MVGPHASVYGVSARPVLQGVLPGGPRCVRELRLSLAPSLQCSSLSHVGVQCCLHDPCCRSGVVLGTLPYFLPAGVLYLGRWLGLRPAAAVPSYRVVLTEAMGLGGVLGSLHCAPLAVGPLPGPPALLCLLSAGCFFGLGAFSFGWGFSLCLTILLASCGCRWACCDPPCGCESARVLPSLLSPSPSGVYHLSRVCSSVGGPVGVAHSFHPSLLLSGGLVRFCGGLCWRCLAMSWACPQPFLCVALVSLIDPVALSPLLHHVFADGFRHWCAFRLCGGASPHAFGSVGALGELRWLHLYRLTPDLIGLRHFAVWLGARVGVSYFPVRHSARIHDDHFVSFPDSCVSLPRIFHGCCSLDTWQDKWLGWLSVPLLALPGLCHLRWLLVTTVWSWCILR